MSDGLQHWMSGIQFYAMSRSSTSSYRTSKVAFARLLEKANTATAVAFLNEPIEEFPYKVHVVVLTDNGIQFADLPKNRSGPTATWRRSRLLAARHRASADQAESSLDQWPSRENEPGAQAGNGAALLL
jgi:hypothetical protein